MKNRLFALLAGVVAALVVTSGFAFADEPAEAPEQREPGYVIRVNPVYPEAAEAVTAEMTAYQEFLAGNTPDFLAEGDGVTVYTTVQAAGLALREAMEARETACTVYFRMSYEEYTTQAFSDIIGAIPDAAMAHTGVPTQGDYLDFNIVGWGWGWGRSTDYGTDADGVYRLTVPLSYTMSYTADADQEALVTAKVAQLKTELGLTGSASDYEKVLAIYDYILTHVTYDYTNLEDTSYMPKYGAYAALIQGTAVCQGYALLFYRLCLEAGIDCRVIPSTTHAWNIVRIGDRYFNVDATWDAGVIDPRYYLYFLLNDERIEARGFNTGDHVRLDMYRTEAYAAAYPVECDYSAQYKGHHNYVLQSVENGVVTMECSVCYGTTQRTLLWGDANGDGKVTSKDVTLICRFIVGTATIDQLACDVNGDGAISSKDATLVAWKLVGRLELFPVEQAA